MTHRLLAHLRSNVVGYIALFVAVLGGGGSYAVAASSHATKKKHKAPTTIVACASSKSGELFLHKGSKKCARGRHKVKWSIKGPKGVRGKTGAAGAAGPAGPPGPTISAAVDTAGSTPAVTAGSGLSVQRAGVGLYTVTVTDATCSKGFNVPVVTATARYSPSEAVPAGATPMAWLDDNTGPNAQFIVHTGYAASGVIRADDLNFDVQDTCQPPTGAAARR